MYREIIISLLLFGKIFAEIPSNLEIEKVDAVVGHSVELPCDVSAEAEDDKINILVWYKGGNNTAFLSRDFRNENETGDISTMDGPGRYQLVDSMEEGIIALQIMSVTPSDAGEYHCFVDFATSRGHKTYVVLRVIEPPQRLFVGHDNGSRLATATPGGNTSQTIGPFYVGDTARFYCVALGGNPRALLSWWAEGQMLDNRSRPLSEMRTRVDVARGPLRREDHGTVLTCVANNNDVTPSLAIDVVIDMYLPPELIAVRDIRIDEAAGFEGVGRLHAGEALPLQCRALGARPPPELHWRVNGVPLIGIEQSVTSDEAQRLFVSEIALNASRDLDEARVTCCAPSRDRSRKPYECAPPLPLTVLYAPVVHISANGDVENNTLTVLKGSDITLNCSSQANPPIYTMMWYKGDDIIEGDNQVAIQPFLELKNVTEGDAGEYVCSAVNDEGKEYSDNIFVINVTYPAHCTDESIAEYGLGENESINLTCSVNANPEPTYYRWVLVNDKVSTFRNQEHIIMETDDATLLYHRPNDTEFGTVFCWAFNGVFGPKQPPCRFLVTDETVPRPPTDCMAVKNVNKDVTVACEPGHDGGLAQKFKFSIKTLDGKAEIVSIVGQEPKFMFHEPKEEQYIFIVEAFNEKGSSLPVEIDMDNIVDESIIEGTSQHNTVANITTLSLALCGGVALVALAACGLVLCAHERSARRELPRLEPPLCAYNTEESNCETYHDSDESTEGTVRRTDSFKKAVSKYPSRNFDVRRTSSFHSARYINDMADVESASKCSDAIRHTNSCRVHSMQNISRKREMDALCDHLVMHLPPETNYHVPKPMNTFYTMPRKSKNKITKPIGDDASEITQTSDGFSLPPPPDEFGTYRAATRIKEKDMPTKSTPTYTTIVRKNSAKESQKNNYNTTMNTVGLPTVSGQTGVYTYPDDNHQPVRTNPFDDDTDS